MSNKMALDALTAIQDAIGMATSGDSSDFVWPKSTMRHPGETAYGWICEKHGLGYQSGCICCAGDLMAYREQKDREARYAREDAIREASKKVRAAIAALQASPQPAIPEGWGFSSADFSLQASGVSEFGGVMLIRTGADRADWHSLTDEQREVIPLYVSGTGRTVAEAIASAAKNCTPLPTPPKD